MKRSEHPKINSLYSSLLKKNGCEIRAFDPAIKKLIHSYSFIKVLSSLKNFFQDLDLVILMTECPEFKKIDVARLSLSMKSRKIIDTKNFLTYIGMGLT